MKFTAILIYLHTRFTVFLHKHESHYLIAIPYMYIDTGTNLLLLPSIGIYIFGQIMRNT